MRKGAKGRLGIPKLFKKTIPPETEVQVVSSKPTEIIYKQRQPYKVKGLGLERKVESLITLTLAEEEGEVKVKFHKDMWNEKDYSHEGLGKVMKELNGDQLTKVTRPEKSL